MSQTLLSMPSAAGLYAQTLKTLARKPGKNIRIPRMEVRIAAVHTRPASIAAYRRICGFQAGGNLPITFPQVQAGPLHLWLMLRPEFPLPLMGIVHLRNTFEVLGPLPADGAYDIRAVMMDGRRTHQGCEFDILTEYSTADGSVVYRAQMTPLYRYKSAAPPLRPRAAPPAPCVSEYRSFDAPSDAGRRYAAVSGDYNPIHLSKLTARALGFPRAIAHGMWSLARATALVESARGVAAKTLSVQFKQPLLLPGKVTVKFNPGAAGTDFSLLSRTADKLHFSGSLG